MNRSQFTQALAPKEHMKKHKPFRKGEATSPPLTYKEGPVSDGRHHLHYELSPFAKQPETHGTFDKATADKINKTQESEMDR